jgi:four helix bundle protein
MSKEFHTQGFEKLEVWQLARQVRFEIYQMTVLFPSDEKYGLTNQIRRSANSISDNIAEGSGRNTNSDKAYFINISYASCLEVINQLITAYDLSYINEDVYTQFRIKMDRLCNMLNAFYRFQINNNQDLKGKFKNE